MRIVLIVIVIIALLGGGAIYYTKYVVDEPTTNFRTVEVERGDLFATIAATGTLEPEELVDVGAQVVGKIKKFGTDPHDPQHKKTVTYTTEVEEGTVLAYIDDLVYKAQFEQAQAAVLRAEADLKQLQAKLLQAERDRKRAEELRSIKDIPGVDRPIKGIADSDYDLAVANHEVAKANLEVGKAVVAQTHAALELARSNLGYTIIKSPIKGTIIDRRVNIGQTVAGGSLNTPSLFLIAKDLRRMEVWAQVNEADIGQIRMGMPVTFTVDAFPKQEFHGKVSQIRLNAKMSQNVVVYTVVVTTDNSNLKLLPYLTANLRFQIQQRHNILIVPNGALRWTPNTDLIDPQMREEYESQIAQWQAPIEKPSAEQSTGKKNDVAKANKAAEEHAILWVADGNYVRPLKVRIGITDGLQTEISGDDLKAGTEVVVGESYNKDNNVNNPFTPKFFHRKRK
ncbi:MAG: efflux RND transporter periplasmic adaptor subunit [Thermoguttaceae bacterium]